MTSGTERGSQTRCPISIATPPLIDKQGIPKSDVGSGFRGGCRHALLERTGRKPVFRHCQRVVNAEGPSSRKTFSGYITPDADGMRPSRSSHVQYNSRSPVSLSSTGCEVLYSYGSRFFVLHASGRHQLI